MKAISIKVKNIRWAHARSDGRALKIGAAGKTLVAFAPDSFGGSWFSIAPSMVRERVENSSNNILQSACKGDTVIPLTN